MKNAVWTKMFGFEVGREMKEMVLAEVANTGEPIEKVVAKYTMPEMAILDNDGKFEYQGKRITPQEWEQLNPLGEASKLIVIKTRGKLKL